MGKTPGSDPVDIDVLLQQAMEELNLKTQAHDGSWGLGKCSWNVDQDEGTIIFTRPDNITATAPVQIIGTFNSTNETWLWSWGNSSILETLSEDAEKVRQFGEEQGIEILTAPKLECDEAIAWELTALACKLCDAQGAYRGPAGATYVFMTFGNVNLSNKVK